MKTLLLKSTRHQTLRFDELQSLVYEAAAIRNSRPLVPMETHVADGPLALTPAHFLTGRSFSFLPTDSSETIVYSYGKHWRFMQRLYNDLWKRWKEEYLVHLHWRGKWKSQQSNFSPGDIVFGERAKRARHYQGCTNSSWCGTYIYIYINILLHRY